MVRCAWLAAVGICLTAGAPAWACSGAEPGPSPADAVLSRLSAYEAFLDELRIDEVPDDFPGRSPAAQAVDRLGGRMMELTRLAARATDAASQEQLQDELTRFDSQLARARRRTRPLAVYAMRRYQGVKHPSWGVALAAADEPILPPAYEFEGSAIPTLELAAEAGTSAAAQVVALSLRGELPEVDARLSGPLRGPGGDLPEGALTVEPVAWRQSREGSPPRIEVLTAGRRNLPDSPARVLLLTVSVPQSASPGIYTGNLLLRAEGRETVGLALQVTVTAPPTAPGPGPAQ